MNGRRRTQQRAAGRMEIAAILVTYALALFGGLAVFASLIE